MPNKLMPSRLKIILAVFSFLSVVMTVAYLTSPEVPHPKRNPDDSLDGFWVMAGGSGCFTGKNRDYLSIKGSDISAISSDNKKLLAKITEMRFVGNKIYFTYQLVGNKNISRKILLDIGNTLVYLKHEIKPEGDEFYERESSVGKVFLRHCSEPSMVGKIALGLGLVTPITQAMP